MQKNDQIEIDYIKDAATHLMMIMDNEKHPIRLETAIAHLLFDWAYFELFYVPQDRVCRRRYPEAVAYRPSGCRVPLPS
jgi:hypothetical protein